MPMIHEISVSDASTHHVWQGKPLYERRFAEVLKFHTPGFAAVTDETGAYHIDTDGNPAYTRRFCRTFGFYEERAAVQAQDGWLHIIPSGERLYPEVYDWCGNYQGGRVVVRDSGGQYFHLDPDGKPVYPQRYRYAGDYRDGIACVREADGLCRHVDLAGQPIHPHRYLDLDVFHKAYARARDEGGWLHINRSGEAVYPERYAAVEPFYNGQAFCETHDGRRVIVGENGQILHVVWPGRSSTETAGRLAVLLIGNVATGKTTLANAMSTELGWPVLSIDAYRMRMGDGSAAGEMAAWSGFLRGIQEAPSAIIECSGSGPFIHQLKHSLRGFERYLVLYLNAPVDTCLQRLCRCRKNVPYPDFGTPLQELVRELGPRLEEEVRLSQHWSATAIQRLDAAQAPETLAQQSLAIVRAWIAANCVRGQL